MVPVVRTNTSTSPVHEGDESPFFQPSSASLIAPSVKTKQARVHANVRREAAPAITRRATSKPAAPKRAQNATASARHATERSSHSHARKIAVIDRSPAPADPRRGKSAHADQSSIAATSTKGRRARSTSVDSTSSAEASATEQLKAPESKALPRKRAHLASHTPVWWEEQQHQPQRQFLAAAGHKEGRKEGTASSAPREDTDARANHAEDDLLHMSSTWRKRTFVVRKLQAEHPRDPDERNRRALAATRQSDVLPSAKFTQQQRHELVIAQKQQRAVRSRCFPPG